MTSTGRAAPLSPERRRAALIDSTLPLLREYGDAVTTRQIAEACGVAEGTIFRAFPDKGALISAALDRALDPTATIAEIRRIDPTLSLEARLRLAATILHQRLTGVFALLGAMRSSQPGGPRAGQGSGPESERSSEHRPGHGSGPVRGFGTGAAPAQASPASCHSQHKARHAGIIDAVADLVQQDAHVLRRTPVEVAELLRALIFSGAHPLISAEAPLSSDEIVSILLDGVRHPEGRTC